jgi:hypothetical protein
MIYFDSDMSKSAKTVVCFDWKTPHSFPLIKKKTELVLRIISLAHVPMYVTDVSIGSINCDPNNANRGRSIIRVT